MEEPMPNEDLINLIKQGISNWNSWKEKNHPIYVDFTNADLEGENLIHADLRWTNLNGANLAGANLLGARLDKATLRGANLLGANLTKTNLNKTNFSNSSLRNVRFTNASISGTNFFGADLDNADFGLAYITEALFPDNDLSVVKGLDSVRHRGPSSISVDTLYKSGGNI